MTQSVLLDLGNVVIGVDFRKVFAYWADAAGVDESLFYERWLLDQAYRDHEIGAVDFETYARALQQRFEVEMPLHAWRDGWNDLWTEPFHEVVELLPAVAERYHLCCFTNTNDTHADCWRDLFGTHLNSFSTIYVSSEIGMRKPDPAAFQWVCRDMQSRPDQTLFLDDTAENVEGAQLAGLDAVLVRDEAAVVRALKALL